MISFKDYTAIVEDMANPADVKRQTTKDIAPLYRWLTQQSGQKVAKNDKHFAKTRDVIGAEIARRAKEGEPEAKQVFKQIMSGRVSRTGRGQFSR